MIDSVDGRVIWLWMGVIGFVLLLGGCTPPGADADPPTATAPAPPTPNPTLAAFDPRAFSAQLTITDSLAQASAQLAAEAGVPADAIRVLFRTHTCTICAQTDDGTALTELTVDEAAPLLEPGSNFWLNVPPLACLYLYDGQQIKPQGCRSQ
jgi:hypothetical protein